ncbi:MAG: 50S ribosomal protein L7/L12, partial [Planctomycetota bacterium]
MSEKVEQVIETLKGMTALELADLKKSIEETFDVTAAAPTMMVAGGGGGGDAAAEEEKTSFTVKLKSAGGQKIPVIKAVRAVVPGLGLKEAKELVDSSANGPAVIKEGVDKDEGEKIKAEIEAAGGEVVL